MAEACPWHEGQKYATCEECADEGCCEADEADEDGEAE
jgi:hypothetical protein